MEISSSTKQAYSEVDEFLELLNDKTKNEIPIKLREFFKKSKDNEYSKKISMDIPIEEQNLKEETLAIIALLNLQYWCKDEIEKEKLKEVYEANEEKYQKELLKQYDIENIFNKDKMLKKDDISSSKELAQYKESIIKRIINKILAFFFKS